MTRRRAAAKPATEPAAALRDEAGDTGRPATRYVPALGGIRGLAVAAVMAYHAGLPWARGGYLGVDAFFVLSGFLITTLLVEESRSKGAVDLARFWARRARRLLPALLLVLLAIAGDAAVRVPAGSLARLRLDSLSALGYLSNWRFLASGQGYFARLASPSLVLHTWSLSIEGQFYLLWPLAVVALLRRRRSFSSRLRYLAALAMGGAALSAAWTAVVARRGSNLSRPYYGTDTRAQSLLVGAALAAMLARRPDREPRGAREEAGAGTRPRSARWAGAGAVAGAGAFLLWAWGRLDGQSPWVYRGLLLVAASSVAVVIAEVTLRPNGPAARVLSRPPLVAVGRVSYGLYLWHWPVYHTLTHAATGLAGLPLAACRVAVTAIVATLSYHLVELPVRQGRLGSWRSWARAAAVPGVAAALVVATLPPALPTPGASAAPASAPASSEPTASTSAPRPVKVLLVGDSIAETLAWGLTAQQARFGVSITDGTLIGCGIARGPLVLDRGQALPTSRCEDWPTRWSQGIGGLDPDVVTVLAGRWEVADRIFEGRWTHIGDARFDSYLQGELDRAIELAGQKGARVALLTTPYFSQPERPDGGAWPEDDPARVDRWNGLLREAAGRHPGVALIDLGAMISPGGHFAQTIGGVVVRDSDGIHLTKPDGGAWVAPRLLPELDALGRARQPTS